MAMLRAEERLVGAGKQGAAAGLLGKKRQADRSQSGGGGGATTGRRRRGGEGGWKGGDQFRFVWMAGGLPTKGSVGRLETSSETNLQVAKVGRLEKCHLFIGQSWIHNTHCHSHSF